MSDDGPNRSPTAAGLLGRGTAFALVLVLGAAVVVGAQLLFRDSAEDPLSSATGGANRAPRVEMAAFDGDRIGG